MLRDNIPHILIHDKQIPPLHPIPRRTLPTLTRKMIHQPFLPPCSYSLLYPLSRQHLTYHSHLKTTPPAIQPSNQISILLKNPLCHRSLEQRTINHLTTRPLLAILLKALHLVSMFSHLICGSGGCDAHDWCQGQGITKSVVSSP